LVDCRETDEPVLAPRDLVWRDRVEPEERFLLAPRLALDDVRRLRVGALLGELLLRGLLFAELPLRADEPLLRADERLLRAGEPLLRERELLPADARPLLRDVAAERPLGRAFVWAMTTHLPHLHRSAFPQ
jgi:hypothetical protein